MKARERSLAFIILRLCLTEKVRDSFYVKKSADKLYKMQIYGKIILLYNKGEGT